MRKLLLASRPPWARCSSRSVARGPAGHAGAPGTVAVHLNGYLQFEIGYYGSSATPSRRRPATSKLNPVTSDW